MPAFIHQSFFLYIMTFCFSRHTAHTLNRNIPFPCFMYIVHMPSWGYSSTQDIVPGSNSLSHIQYDPPLKSTKYTYTLMIMTKKCNNVSMHGQSLNSAREIELVISSSEQKHCERNYIDISPMVIIIEHKTQIHDFYTYGQCLFLCYSLLPPYLQQKKL